MPKAAKKLEKWPTAMKMCGMYIPGAEEAPNQEEWPKIQLTLARIIQARTAWLKSSGRLDNKEKNERKEEGG